MLVHELNLVFGWWKFAGGDIYFSGMPLELYIGWMIAWGLVPQLALHRLPLWLCAICMGLLDLTVMPLCAPVVELGRHWLIGEVVCLLLVLIPALCIARFTLDNTHLVLRAWMQIAISGGVFLFLIPEIAFAARPGREWLSFTEMPGWQLQIAMQLMAIMSLPGVGAVMEFAERGGGTPIPFDPPVRLVTSGIYRYCANPMQICSTLVLLAWAALLRNGWLLWAPLVSLIYSAGIAEWDERDDMERRYGESWRRYRRYVRNWKPRWKPYHDGEPAQLYVAASCGPCSELWQWIMSRDPVGLKIVAAETLPHGSIRRMRYLAEGRSSGVEGVRALGRALEHLHLGWAIAGIALRLPGVWQFVQLMMDASGLGPRVPNLPTCHVIASNETLTSPAEKRLLI